MLQLGAIFKTFVSLCVSLHFKANSKSYLGTSKGILKKNWLPSNITCEVMELVSPAFKKLENLQANILRLLKIFCVFSQGGTVQTEIDPKRELDLLLLLLRGPV